MTQIFDNPYTYEPHTLGVWGEKLAQEKLKDKKYSILDTNWRINRGEIDIIAHDITSQTLAFIEVKTRKETSFVNPYDAVDMRKYMRIRKLACAWIHDNKVHAPHIRIDLIAITVLKNGAYHFEHCEGVI